MVDRRLVPATVQHAEVMAGELIPLTAREAVVLTGKQPLEALIESLEGAEEAWTYLIDGEPVSMAGVRPHPQDKSFGLLWVVSTPGIYRAKISFLRVSRALVLKWMERYSTLGNLVHSENTPTIQWVEWLGCFVDRERPVIIQGETFFPCVRKRGV